MWQARKRRKGNCASAEAGRTRWGERRGANPVETLAALRNGAAKLAGAVCSRARLVLLERRCGTSGAFLSRPSRQIVCSPCSRGDREGITCRAWSGQLGKRGPAGRSGLEGQLRTPCLVSCGCWFKADFGLPKGEEKKKRRSWVLGGKRVLSSEVEEGATTARRRSWVERGGDDLQAGMSTLESSSIMWLSLNSPPRPPFRLLEECAAGTLGRLEIATGGLLSGW